MVGPPIFLSAKFRRSNFHWAGFFDVFPDAGHFVFVADDVFIIIALPQFPGKRRANRVV